MSDTRTEARLKKLLQTNAGQLKTAPVALLKTPQTPRTSQRARAFKFAIIRFNRDTEVTCIIRDLSISGVGVTLDTAIGLPETILLIVPQHAIKALATVRWQRSRDAGLQFVVPLPRLAELR